MPYREAQSPDERLSRAAVETNLAWRNMRACRIVFITLTAAASVWPYLHLQGLSILHTTFACVTLVCVFEEWRLARMLRRQLAKLRRGERSEPSCLRGGSAAEDARFKEAESSNPPQSQS